jgi:hypothetical protein
MLYDAWSTVHLPAGHNTARRSSTDNYEIVYFPIKIQGRQVFACLLGTVQCRQKHRQIAQEPRGWTVSGNHFTSAGSHLKRRAWKNRVEHMLDKAHFHECERSQIVCVWNTVFPHFTVKFKNRNIQRRIYVRIVFSILTLYKIKNT